MLKIDLKTLKQEKNMKEKSSSLQIKNLKQKLSETQRVLEDLKISSKRDKGDATDLRRRVDEVEEQLETFRRPNLRRKTPKISCRRRTPNPFSEHILAAPFEPR